MNDQLHQSPLDDILIASIASHVSLVCEAQRPPVDAVYLNELITGLCNLALAIDAFKSAGLSNLTKELIDLRFAQAKLIGLEQEQQQDKRSGRPYADE